MTYGHKTGHTADAGEEFFLALPPEIDPLLGIYVAQMGPICANGMLHAAAELFGTDVRDLGDGVRGRTVLVIGAGVVGLLTALFCAALRRGRGGGCRSLAVPPRARPRRWALPRSTSARPGAHVKARWNHGGGDRGADFVFQCRAQRGQPARRRCGHCGRRAP